MKQKKDPKETQSEPLKAYIKYSTIGFQMALMIGGGFWLGHWLDQEYGLPDSFLYTLLIGLPVLFFSLYLALKDLLR